MRALHRGGSFVKIAEMKRIEQFFAEKPTWLAPVLSLALSVIAFGLFIPFLGFYWDDWPTIFYTYNERISSLFNHFTYDRPYSAWAYWLVGRFGTMPLTWHLAALLIRWAVVVALGWALQPLWPKHVRKIVWISLIFAIYPGYYLQPSAVIFIPHLAAYGLFFVSLGAMGRAYSERKRFGVYTALAVISGTMHMFMVEYYVGLELVRPIYLWLLAAKTQPRKARITEVVKAWLPYGALFGVWMSWRLFWLELPVEPYPLVFAQAIRSNPIAGSIELAQVMVRDLFYVLLTAWAEAGRALVSALGTAIGQLGLVLATLTGVGLWLTLTRFSAAKRSENEDVRFGREALLLGMAGFIFGMLPIWIIGETIAQGEYNLRYTLVAMFGASLVVIGLLTLLIKKESYRILLVSLLVAVTIASHVHAGSEYKTDWEVQRSLYWQLYWRAPSLEESTALISFERLTVTMGDPMTGNALNVLYPQRGTPPNADLWNFELNRTRTENAIRAGEQLTNDYRGLEFSTQAQDDLVFYHVETDACLWMLGPEHAANDYLPEEQRDLVSYSNLDNIVPSSYSVEYPARSIFGREPEQGWCFYFQKADLARQMEDWSGVIALMQEAEDRLLFPSNGIEWLPLLEAYLRTEEWEAAGALSASMHEMQSRSDAMICATWAGVDAAPIEMLQSLVNCEDE
jgi:hypothetical protein